MELHIRLLQFILDLRTFSFSLGFVHDCSISSAECSSFFVRNWILVVVFLVFIYFCNSLISF